MPKHEKAHRKKPWNFQQFNSMIFTFSLAGPHGSDHIQIAHEIIVDQGNRCVSITTRRNHSHQVLRDLTDETLCETQFEAIRVQSSRVLEWYIVCTCVAIEDIWRSWEEATQRWSCSLWLRMERAWGQITWVHVWDPCGLFHWKWSYLGLHRRTLANQSPVPGHPNCIEVNQILHTTSQRHFYRIYQMISHLKSPLKVAQHMLPCNYIQPTSNKQSLRKWYEKRSSQD